MTPRFAHDHLTKLTECLDLFVSLLPHDHEIETDIAERLADALSSIGEAVALIEEIIESERQAGMREASAALNECMARNAARSCAENMEGR